MSKSKCSGEKGVIHKTSGKVWIVLLVDRSTLGASSVGALHKTVGGDPEGGTQRTFQPRTARQFKNEKAAQAFIDQPVNDIPKGYGAYPAEITLVPRPSRRAKVKIDTPFGRITMREGETTFLDKVGVL